MPVFSIADTVKESQRSDITAIRNKLHFSPIDITFTGLLGEVTVSIDCDEESEAHMRDKINSWASLGKSTVMWTLADDGEVEVGLIQLTAILDKMIESRGIRGDALHEHARALKASLPVAAGSDIFKVESWPV